MHQINIYQGTTISLLPYRSVELNPTLTAHKFIFAVVDQQMFGPGNSKCKRERYYTNRIPYSSIFRLAVCYLSRIQDEGGGGVGDGGVVFSFFSSHFYFFSFLLLLVRPNG